MNALYAYCLNKSTEAQWYSGTTDGSIWQAFLHTLVLRPMALFSAACKKISGEKSEINFSVKTVNIL